MLYYILLHVLLHVYYVYHSIMNGNEWPEKQLVVAALGFPGRTITVGSRAVRPSTKPLLVQLTNKQLFNIYNHMI